MFLEVLKERLSGVSQLAATFAEFEAREEKLQTLDGEQGLLKMLEKRWSTLSANMEAKLRAAAATTAAQAKAAAAQAAQAAAARAIAAAAERGRGRGRGRGVRGRGGGRGGGGGGPPPANRCSHCGKQGHGPDTC